MMTGVFFLVGYLFGAANVLLIHYFTRYQDDRPDLGGFGGPDND